MLLRRLRRAPLILVCLVGAALICAVGLAFLLPLLVALPASLQDPSVPFGDAWLAQRPHWSNYRDLATRPPLLRAARNSLAVAGVAVPLTILSASWAGLGMARLGTVARRRLTLLALLLTLMPLSTLWLPRLVLVRSLGLDDNLATLILPALLGTNPFFVLLFYWTFRRLPQELFDSAQLDGAGPLHCWRTLALPLARRTSVVVVVLAFIHYWSDFVTPLLYLRSELRYTLPVGLYALGRIGADNWPLLLAGALVMLMPVAALFMVTRRYFWTEGRFGG